MLGGLLAVGLGLVAPRVELVVRGPAPSGLGAEEIADALGLPLAGSMRAEPRLAASLERGEPPGAKARSPLSRLSDRLVAALLTSGGADRAA